MEKSRTLMAERDAQIFGKGRAFAMRTDQSWLPPSAKDVDAVLAEPAKETEAQQGCQGLC